MKYFLCVFVAVFMMFLIAGRLHADAFDYASYIDSGLDKSTCHLLKIGYPIIYECELREFTKKEKHLYWCGVHNALQDIKYAESHSRWVNDNNLEWNGTRWVPKS